MRPEDLIPIRTLTDLMDSAKAKLRDLKFKITNLRPGGVFYTLLEIPSQGLADLYKLLKSIVPQIYLDTATGIWLDAKAADYEVFRKEAQKTQGIVIMGRYSPGDNVVITKGKVVATEVNTNGERLKYMVTAKTVMESDALEVEVLVVSEFAGAEYNVGADMITEMVTNIDGVDYIRNGEDWITREGADTESDDSLRRRAKAKWNELAQGGIDNSYKSWAQSIPGVVVVQMDSLHPRGQGTVDVIITGTGGIPSDDLINQVQEYLDKKKSLVADLVVIKPEPVQVDFDVILYLNPDYGEEDVAKAEAEQIIDIMFQYGDTDYPEISKVSPEYGLIIDQVRHNLLNIDHVVKAPINSPVEDIVVSKRQLLVKGNVNVSVQRVVT
ncbi:MAG: hypothetical protein FH756_02400 [Firmicutes bacterium]|nr:hypothetical protein [Bacillota bacterium]